MSPQSCCQCVANPGTERNSTSAETRDLGIPQLIHKVTANPVDYFYVLVRQFALWIGWRSRNCLSDHGVYQPLVHGYGRLPLGRVEHGIVRGNT
jgi:hypothetical protein